MIPYRKSNEESVSDLLSKVPQVTLMFWVIKICATTVGETGGDSLSMTLKLGYAVSSLIVLGFFVVALAAQVSSDRYVPYRYWAVVVVTTTIGTTMSDYLDRTLKLGYPKASLLLFCGVIAILFLWRRVMGRLVFENITDRKDEVFYWVAILVSNTLGTALGDFVAEDAGLGFQRGALVFAGLFGIVTLAYFFTKISGSVLFWAAYILTRPLGATLGDTLTKPNEEGGLELGRITSSLVIATLMVVMIFLTYRKVKPAPVPAPAERS
jgi:uncharacterized membrane-anchored protein